MEKQRKNKISPKGRVLSCGNFIVSSNEVIIFLSIVKVHRFFACSKLSG